VDGGHAERFCVGVLEIIEAGERVVGEARGCSVDEVGALGVLKDLLEGTFHCRCGSGIEGKVVVKMSTNK
jgi:stage III sporulation protein SpoIIIAA